MEKRMEESQQKNMREVFSEMVLRIGIHFFVFGSMDQLKIELISSLPLASRDFGRYGETVSDDHLEVTPTVHSR